MNNLSYTLTPTVYSIPETPHCYANCNNSGQCIAGGCICNYTSVDTSCGHSVNQSLSSMEAFSKNQIILEPNSAQNFGANSNNYSFTINSTDTSGNSNCSLQVFFYPHLANTLLVPTYLPPKNTQYLASCNFVYTLNISFSTNDGALPWSAYIRLDNNGAFGLLVEFTPTATLDSGSAILNTTPSNTIRSPWVPNWSQNTVIWIVFLSLLGSLDVS